jgi:DNA-binding IclR family transcriptional regulator
VSQQRVIKSAQRTLEILECFRERRMPLNASAMSRALRYPQSSTVLLLKSLMHLGYLAFDQQTKTYFPSPRVTLLGDWIDDALFGGEHVIEVLEQLNEQFGETTYIAIQKGLVMQYIHSLPGKNPLTLRITPGVTNSLFGSSVGRAILSMKTGEEIAGLITRFNRTVTARDDVVDPDAVFESVGKVRQSGYASVYDTILEGAGGIAVPVASRMPGNVYAIGLGGPSRRIAAREKQIAGRMLELTASMGRGERPQPESFASGIAAGQGITTAP